MPHGTRRKGESGFYHVVTKRDGGQVIFEDDRDRRRFGAVMRNELGEKDASLFAWCFMQNHVHLLLHCSMETLSALMGRILADYAMYYNKRHARVGHLFQGRFHSKAVQSERQFLATVRYIHQNPLALGINDLAAYRWSSYREYVGRPFVSNVAFTLEVFGGVESFVAAHEIVETDRSLEPGCSGSKRFESEDQAIERAKIVAGCSELSEIAAAEKQSRDAMLASLKADGFTERQIARLTGISRSVVNRAR